MRRLGEALTFGINPSLDGIRALTAALDNPQESLRCIQITGTNGKTSVARMTGALLTIAGRPNGVYTSPHLVSYTERMEIGGAPVSEADFAEAMSAVFATADTLDRQFTEFELLTAGALWLFRARRLEWAVLEVGMGGRWDATSVVVPEVAVITGVGLDHTDRLGDTREAIAEDKAHIIKERSRVVLGPGCTGVEEIFERRAAAMGSPLVGYVGSGRGPGPTWEVRGRPRSPGGLLTIEVDFPAVRSYRVSVNAPSYQAPNIATAMTVAGIALMEAGPPNLVFEALKGMQFPGRFEVLRRDPALVIDGAHNPQAAAMLASAIEEAFGDELPVIVLAVLADKDMRGIVDALVPFAHSFIVTTNGSPRCMPADELAAIVAAASGHAPTVQPDLARALTLAMDRGRGVVVTGSLYTAGRVRGLLKG
jgi:dihydrofolate synthase/folylpolyglutamate synthase